MGPGPRTGLLLFRIQWLPVPESPLRPSVTSQTLTVQNHKPAAQFDWTIVGAPRLTNGRAKHSYRIVDGNLPKGGFLISREDVAHFMIGEAENPAHLKQIVGVCN